MKFGGVVRPRADRDMDDIASHFVEQSGLDIGLRFVSELFETFALLSSRPELG